MRHWDFALLLIFGLIFFWIALDAQELAIGAQPETVSLLSETKSIRTLDDRDLTLLIDRPDQAEKAVPLLIVIDGSGCGGAMRPGFDTLFKPGPGTPVFARMRVEKRGVDPLDIGDNCSKDFMRHYTMQSRVSDHLRAFQHLRSHADWWNGELLIFGWSDGGDIAGQLVSQYPLVTRAVLGAMGGGYTMAEHFRDFWICPGDMTTEDQAGCQQVLEDEFSEIFDEPSWLKTKYGPDNSWKAWNSRLWTRLSNTLVDNQTPILIVHGSEDFDNTPVQSARKLVESLSSAGNTAYTYWEVPQMGHGWMPDPSTGFDQADAIAIERAMLDWLLTDAADQSDLCELELVIDCA